MSVIINKLKNYMMDKHNGAMSQYADYYYSLDKITLKNRAIGYIYFAKLLFVDYKRKLIKKGEFEDNRRIPIDKLFHKLMKYDVISFDIFDTLILRNVEKTSDVFRIVGHKLDVIGFEKIRKSAEKYCVKILKKKHTIYDIYERINALNGIDKDEGISCEFDTELTIIEHNPYFMELYNRLLHSGKKIILVSDMYWPKGYIEKMLKKCGYKSWNELYVSCEHGTTKSDGGLFELVKKNQQPKDKIIHIGDDFFSDKNMSRKKGMQSIKYKKVSSVGSPYRYSNLYDESIGESIANSVINNEVFNGVSEMNEFQRHGFIYGGKLVAGFCRWLNQEGNLRGVDKLLFLARDADVIHKCYNKYYNEIDSEYTFASRRSVLLLVFDRYPELYINRLLRESAENYNNTIANTLKESHMSCLIGKLDEVGLEEMQIFNADNYDIIVGLIYKYKDEIINEISGMIKAAEVYFKKVIGNHKTIGLVDVGWQGTIFVCLNYFLNDICKLNVKLYNFQLITKREGWNQQYYDQRCMLSYCCSSDDKKELNDKLYNKLRIFIMESLFSSNGRSVIEYSLNDSGESDIVFGSKAGRNEKIVDDIHYGITKYVERFSLIEKSLNMELSISGENAFASVYNLYDSRKYMYKMFKDYELRQAAGEKSSDITMGQFMKKNGYV